MIPAKSNKEVAEHTTAELLFGIPEAFGIRSFFRNLTICLLEDRVRIAMMFADFSFVLPALFSYSPSFTGSPLNLGTCMRSLQAPYTPSPLSNAGSVPLAHN